MKSESVKQVYAGPWAPLRESNGGTANQVAKIPQRSKVRRISKGEKSVSNESETNDWNKVKLAALQRAFEFTQKTEFVNVFKSDWKC